MDDQPSYDYAKAITSSVEDTQIIFCDSKAGTGKALRNGSKVQTPKGPIPIEELKSKDEVFGSDGKVHSVTGVYPQGKKRIYEVHFSNGSIVECCKDHLWTYQKEGEEDFQTKSLEDIINKNELNKERIFMPQSKAVEYEEKRYSTPPYLLGLIVGGGDISPSFFDEEDNLSVDRIKEEADKINAQLVRVDDSLFDIEVPQDEELYEDSSIRKKLDLDPIKKTLHEVRYIPKKEKNRFIPEEYLYGGIKQRLNVLRGILDIRGECHGDWYSYETLSSRLANEVQQIAQSLGLVVTISERETYSDSNQGFIYHVGIQTSVETDKLHLSKRNQENWFKRENPLKIHIEKIVETDREDEMTCIAVDSDDHLFLTEDFIPTHNTSQAMAGAYYRLMKGDSSKIIYVRNTLAVRENGFLPGDAQEKELQFMTPAKESIDEIGLRLGNSQSLFDRMTVEEEIEVISTSYIRGRDFQGSPTVIIDEAQNLDTTELQTVLTRVHDDAKVIVIGSSLQCDNKKLKKFGSEKLTPFQLYIEHFKKQDEIPYEVINLTKNYRGNLANYSDQIGLTIDDL